MQGQRDGSVNKVLVVQPAQVAALPPRQVTCICHLPSAGEVEPRYSLANQPSLTTPVPLCDSFLEIAKIPPGGEGWGDRHM